MYNQKIIDKSEFIYYFYLIITLIQYYDSLSIELHNLLNHIYEYRHVSEYFKDFNCVKDENPNINITKGEIIFKNVTAGYKDKIIFSSLNLTIPKNAVTGILGPNGVGKSTLFKLLLGFLPYQGEILIDNQDISKFNIKSIRNNIGFVNQQSMLFNRSIYENLSYGNNKTLQEINKYFYDNNLEDFIKAMGPDGLDTMVYKNGESISGGQRCILNIIKCIFDDKKIFLIDEPSNNLDKDMKKFLIEIIKNLKDKTIIIITHDKELDGIFNTTITFDK